MQVPEGVILAGLQTSWAGQRFLKLFFCIFTARFRRTRGLAVTFCRQTLTQLVPPGGGTTMWRRREEGRGVVPPCGGGGRRGEGWSHRVEEEGGEVVQHL